MLKTLLKLDPKTFELYIIAASFPKMLNRMDNRSKLGKCYYTCLKGIKTLDYRDIATGSMDDSLNDETFFDYLPSIINFLPNSYYLKEISELHTKPSEVYNKETCVEFHTLLCTLLSLFYDSLIRLQTLQKSKDRPRDVEKIRNELISIRVVGVALRATVKGAEIEKHLKNIEHLLVADYHNGESGTATVTIEESESDEDVTESDALKPSSMHHGKPLLLWQSYKDWLRLLVIYFDASHILEKHLKTYGSRNNIDIDIMVLAPSDPDSEMLPWKKLLRHKTYFPRPPNKSESESDQPSADELITFLTQNEKKDEKKQGKGQEATPVKRTTIGEVQKLVENLEKHQESKLADPDSVDSDTELTTMVLSITMTMNDFQNYSLPGWDQYILNINEQLSALALPKQTPQGRLNLIWEIAKDFETLRRHSVLYENLKEGSSLSLGKGFRGVRHCEVCIASLVGKPGPTQYKELLSNFEVSHIFMLCLDVCQVIQYREVDQL